jgi:hypothetical protein
MQTLELCWVAGFVGWFGIVACDSDSKGNVVEAGGSSGYVGEGGTAGSAHAGDNADAGMSGDGGTGGAVPACPSDLRSAPGKLCTEAGQTCGDPGASCEHNWSVQCVDGNWTQLPGSFPPCAGSGGESGAGEPATSGGSSGGS